MSDSEPAVLCSLLLDNRAIHELDGPISEHFEHEHAWGMLTKAKRQQILAEYVS